MKKTAKRKIGILFAVFAFIIICYKFLLPTFVDLNKYTKDISKVMSDTADLDFAAKNIKFDTTWDFGIKIKLDGIKLNYKDGTPVSNIDYFSIKFPLLPLVSKKFEIQSIELTNPQIYLTREASGKYRIEKNIEKFLAGPPPPLTPVIKGLNIKFDDYTIDLTDKYNPQHVVIKGKNFKIKNFNPDKGVAISSTGQILTQNNPNINYDIAFKTLLPFKEQPKAASKPAISPNPFESLTKYNIKADIKGDLALKDVKKEPKLYGDLSFDNLSLKLNAEQIPASSGKIVFKGEGLDIASNINLDKNSSLNIEGYIKYIQDKKAEIKVKTTPIQLEKVQRIAIALADIAKQPNEELKKTKINGTIIADFSLNGDLKKCDFKGFSRISNVNLSNPQLPKAVNNFNAYLSVKNNKLTIENTYGYLSGVKFNIKGDIDRKSNLNIKADVPQLQLKTIEALINTTPQLKETRKQLKGIAIKGGSIGILADIQGDFKKPVIKAKVNVINASAVAQGYPVNVQTASITADDKDLNLEKSTIKILNSTISAKGTISDYNKKQDINIISKGYLTASDAKKFLDRDTASLILAKGSLPVIANITGTPKALSANAQIKMDINNKIVLTEMDLVQNIARIININAQIENNKAKLNEIGLYGLSVNKVLSDDLAKNLIGSSKLLLITGAIGNITSKDPIINNIQIKTLSPLNLRLPQLGNATVRANINLIANGKTSNPDIKGKAVLSTLNAPLFDLKADEIALNLTNSGRILSSRNLKLAGSTVDIDADVANESKPPFTVRRLDINTAYLDLDKLQSLMLQSNSSSSSPVPITITKGVFKANKLKSGNTIALNTSMNFNLNKAGLLELNNFATSAFSGGITGNASCNIIKNTFKINAKANNIDSAKLTKELSGKQQISGSLSGNMNISTKGSTPEQMARNAVGDADFVIKKGEMGELGRFEYYLKAANIASSNIFGYGLNKIINLVETKKTGLFEEMKGKIYLSGHEAQIESITSRGRNLSLFIVGNINLQSNTGNLSIYGRTSTGVANVLGPLGNFTVEGALSKIPKVGKYTSILSTIPQIAVFTESTNKENLKEIPALIPESLSSKPFLVRINGNLGKPAAVKSFKWLSIN